jgi:two-component system chemotaxis response regulator CheY
MNNILIVDDSPTMRRMVTASLRSLPAASFEEAASGLEAIERVALAPVDLIILDLNMPDMHGLEVLDFLRSHQAYRDIPVIVLTTRGDEASRRDALAAGASLYLTKPFAPQALAAQAQALLRLHPERA